MASAEMKNAPRATPPKNQGFKLPKSLASCADLLYETKAKRLEVQKIVEELQARETALREHLINNLPKSDATGVAGKIARATVTLKEVPRVEDWDKLWSHIKKTGAFEILQKRISSAAVEERWEAGKKVPGVEKFNAVTISLNKV